ncbi:hypothetical protein QNZ76_004556 [Vibrio parahaemolyticus]|nr:hypothetical protein [Vibrio parahaemolyticus]ELB2229725.1 hypothetical protein [Vibrio parahaemolyticus]
MKAFLDIALNIFLACFAGWVVGWQFGILYMLIYGVAWLSSNQLIENLNIYESCLFVRIVVNVIGGVIALVLNFTTEKTLAISADSQSAKAEAIDITLKGLSGAEGTLGMFRDGMQKNSDSLKNQAESFNMYNNVFCELNWWQMTFLTFLLINILVSVIYIVKSKK